MNKITGRKPGYFVAHPIGSDIVILNREGICVASTNSKKIGSQMDISNFNKQHQTDIKIGRNSYDFVYEQSQYESGELALLKKLAQMTLEQYIRSISQPPTGSLDQFMASFLKLPANSDNFNQQEEAAQSYGINLELKRSAVIVEIENFAKDNLSSMDSPDYTSEDVIKDWKNKIISAITGFFTIKTDIIAVYVGNDRFVFFKEIIGDEKKFIRNMKTAYNSIFAPLITGKNQLAVAFSDPHSGVRGLHESYHEALLALNHGKRFSKNLNQSFYYEDLGAIRILSEENIEKKKYLAQEVLKPLEKEMLRDTLETFFNEDMDIKRTAQKLKVHPNTVNYRLGRIADNLGLDPKVFKQAFELRIALLTDQIFA